MNAELKNICNTTNRMIELILKENPGDSPLYPSLYSTSVLLSQKTGISPPVQGKGIPYLLELHSWIGKCLEILSKTSFYDPTQEIFCILQNTVQRKTVESLESSISEYFRNLPASTREYISNFMELYRFWGQIDPETGEGTLPHNRAVCLKNHWEDISWLYSRLADHRSKYVLCSILLNWLSFNQNGLNRVQEKLYPSYFDTDILPCDSQEVFVDLGVYVGDSINDFIRTFPTYHKIYGYEIDSQNYAQAVTNLQGMPNIDLRYKAISDYDGTIQISTNTWEHSNSQLTSVSALDYGAKNEQIPCVTLDSDISEPITLLKMDIEGSEQAALRGARRHIENEKPKLTICTYHGNDALWEIPRIIDHMRSDYTFYMRYNGGKLVPTEYVLICV